jgi:hypothetical protein
MDDYQDYHIILSSDFDITPEEFADAWNETTKARDMAEANVTTPQGTSFEPITITLILITVATGIAVNVISDQINGVIKQIREKHSQQKKQEAESKEALKPAHIKITEKRDGTSIVAIDIDE